MKIQTHFLILVGIFLFCSVARSQDVEGLINEAKSIKAKVKNTLNDSLKISGGISASSELNFISGSPRRSGPFNYQLNGALNISKYGFSLPLSLNFSNERFVYNYDLPAIRLPSYSFAGMTPTFKWASLLIGDRTMDFSPYTLSGHGFRGLGTELKPGSFYFAAMYGRLQRAQAEDLNSLQSLDPVYKRMAWGMKMGYDNGTENIYFILFRGWDDPNSLDLTENIPGLSPADNTAVSIQGQKQLSEKYTLSVDYALSAFTEDQRMNRSDANGVFPSVLGLFKPRVNSEYFHAIKTSLGMQVKWGQFNLAHEWVQPGYRTLGALFFNNDFENWTIGTNLNLWEDKISLSTNTGIQRNNLNGELPNTSRRFVGDVNVTLTLNESLNINTSYSNFRNTSKLSTLSQPQVLVDSLILSQVNQNANVSVSYLSGEEKNSTYTAAFSYNQANSIENDQVQENGLMRNYIASLSHSYVFTESNLSLTSAMLATWNQTALQSIFSPSPTISVQKSFLEDQLKATSNFSYVWVYTDGLFSNSVINWQAGVDYTLFEKHSLSMSFALINRKLGTTEVEPIEGPSTSNFTEAIWRLNYRWSF